jgi:hypothetical protein
MILPIFLYDNVLRGITPTWSGTTVTDSEPANSTDWRDFSLFEADTGTLDFEMSTDTDIDSVSVFVSTYSGGGSESIVLQYESSPSTFTALKTISPCGGKLTFGQFSSVTVLSGRKIRFVITAGTTLLIRQLVVGEAMVAETGQFASMQYPTLLGGLKLTNSISANGSILGRDVKRVERMGSLNLDLLTPAWVRGTWEPFAYHAARYPFIYVPNFAAYPNEVAFSVAESIDAPSNMGKGERMAVQWKLRHVVADEYGV